MTGPEHYREAERIVRHAHGQEIESAAVTLADAQVHATLARTAAVAESGGLANVGTLGVLSPWGRATSGEERS